MNTNVEAVEAACTRLVDKGEAITFVAVACQSGISRTTLYRNPQLRVVVEEYRHRSYDRHTLTGLYCEIAFLRNGLEALADRIRKHEERLRNLESLKFRHKAN